MRLLNQSQVVELLPMTECIGLMDGVLRTLAAGGAQLPLRTVLRLPEQRGIFGVMPAQLSSPDTLGLKAIAVFPGNEGTRLDSHQGVVLLLDPVTGAPLAILDASSITAIRTAAVSAVATRALAREDAGDLAILGSGVQARSHLEAMAAVRRLHRVRVYSPNPVRLAAFGRWAERRLGISAEPATDPASAVEGADLICTTTASRTPVVLGDWIKPGAHINAVGSSIPTARELDSRAVARGRLFVDRRESATNEAGDYLIPLGEGAIGAGHILGELGEVLTGAVRGRIDPSDVTIFKSLGIAVEDLASAHHVLRGAEARGIGLVTELGGLRE
jgi:ornithine cyclodeaminase/alanine dehydrogenase-like protein (mu-crystallin family)